MPRSRRDDSRSVDIHPNAFHFSQPPRHSKNLYTFHERLNQQAVDRAERRSPGRELFSPYGSNTLFRNYRIENVTTQR